MTCRSVVTGEAFLKSAFVDEPKKKKKVVSMSLNGCAEIFVGSYWLKYSEQI